MTLKLSNNRVALSPIHARLKDKEQYAASIKQLIDAINKQVVAALAANPATNQQQYLAIVDAAMAEFLENETLGREISKTQADIVQANVDKRFITNFRRATGVDHLLLNAGIAADTTIGKNFIKLNVSLIKSIPQTLNDEIHDAVTKSIVDSGGFDLQNLSQSLQQRFNVSKSHADLIAFDQTGKLNAQFTQARAQTVGNGDYIWQNAGDNAVRQTHVVVNGQQFSFHKPPQVIGENPGQPIRCRCVALVIVRVGRQLISTL